MKVLKLLTYQIIKEMPVNIPKHSHYIAKFNVQLHAHCWYIEGNNLIFYTS